MEEKLLLNDDVPTYFRTQINMYKQMAQMNVCTYTRKCAVGSNSHARRPFEAELKVGGVFRTRCCALNPKSFFCIFFLCLLIALRSSANSLSPIQSAAKKLQA